MPLNALESSQNPSPPSPHPPWKNCLPQNQPLCQRLETAASTRARSASTHPVSSALRTVPGIQRVLTKYLLHTQTNEWMGHFRHTEGAAVVVPGVQASVLTTPHEDVSPHQGCEAWKDGHVCPRVTQLVDQQQPSIEQGVERPQV